VSTVTRCVSCEASHIPGRAVRGGDTYLLYRDLHGVQATGA